MVNVNIDRLVMVFRNIMFIVFLSYLAYHSSYQKEQMLYSKVTKLFLNQTTDKQIETNTIPKLQLVWVITSVGP